MESEEDEGPAPKRARQSHEKNQLPQYCYCARCRGKVTQKPATIRDHQKRYPRRDTPEVENNAFEGDGGPPGSSQDRVLGDITNSQDAAQSAPPSPNPRHSPLHPASPIRPPDENWPENIFTERLPHAGGHSNPSTAPSTPPRRNRAPREQGDEEFPADDELPEDDDNRLHRFDRLLDDDDELGGHGFNDGIVFPGFHPGDANGREPDNPPEDEDEDDVNFGLPAGNIPPPADPPRQFQLPEEPPEDDPEEPVEVAQHCAAFEEPAPIRNIYIDAFIQKTVFGATHRALRQQLKSARRTLSSHPGIPPENLAQMAQTIRAVERRLGIDYSDIVTTYTLCPKCGRCYSPEDVSDREADDNLCANDGCPGILFTQRRLASGSTRRVSSLTFPFASPIAWLRHMLVLSGIFELLQHWREDDDGDDQRVPITPGEWMDNLDQLRSLCDMCTGHGWRSTMAGLERTLDPDTGEVRDWSPLNPPRRFSSLPLGILLSMNTDWFQPTKENNYSVGAVYLVINNLPRHMRFVREHICLAIVMPGPKEPTDYALDQMMTPLIDELLELKQGVVMTVRHGDPARFSEQRVYAELTQHIADLIARIKMGGGAGVRSELNFCLYCRARLSSLSVPAGYMRRDIHFRNPQEDLDNAYYWRSLDTEGERRAFFEFTGNKFTSLHRIPGWHTSSCSPPDAMHLLYLGGMNWILKQILVSPGMLNKRDPNDRSPLDIFNECLDEMWVPNSYQRLPPKLGQTNTRDKADQLKLCSNIIPVPLFLAMRDGDTIGPGCVPRGRANTTGAKHQVARAKALHRERCKYFNSIGRPDLCPESWEECMPSRNLSFHYKQVLRYGLAVKTLDNHSITPTEVAFAQELLEKLCIDYARANVPLSPNFHYMMHIEEFMLKTGSIYNTHVWAMERANGTLTKINHNGRSGGVLEGTLMRGWWSYAALQNLIHMLRTLPNRTPEDDEVIHDLITALRSGPESAQQQGTLLALIAQTKTAYTRLHGVTEPIKLSNQSRVIDLEEVGIYQLVLDYCMDLWPDAGIFGHGMVDQVHLPPVGVVRNFSYVERDGLCYGSHLHTSGKGYCYGYIDHRQPVRVERILQVDIPGHPELRTVFALARLFQLPRIEPEFPWHTWAAHYGISSWAYDSLSEMLAIPVTRFSGHFALFRIPMSYGEYWVTVSLDHVKPERDGDDEAGA